MILRIIVDVLLVIGAFFALAGTVGMIRMPDALSRMQCATNIATLGLICALIGGLLYAIFVMNSAISAIKIAVIGGLYILSNPVSSHVVCRAAYKSGVDGIEQLVCDDMKGEGEGNV